MSETSAAPAAAAISIRPTLANSKWLDKTCPKCQKPLAVGEQVVLCPKCYTPQHAQCWRDNNNTCAVEGTPARLIERPGRAAAPAPAGDRPAVAPTDGASAPAPAGATPRAAPAAAAPAAPATAAPAAAVPGEPVDPYKYAQLVPAPPVADLWRRNIMTVVVLLFVWGIIVAVYSIVVYLGAPAVPA